MTIDPLAIDVQDSRWSIEEKGIAVNAIANINMIHISPWSACLGLIAGANRLLPPGGILYLYGPFKRGGEHTAPSNLAFDESLRAQNPAWGVRNLEDAEKGRWLLIPLGMIVFLCMGTVYSWSIFRKPLEKLLDIGATESLLPFTLFLVLFAVLMPITGFYIDRVGARKDSCRGLVIKGEWLLVCLLRLREFVRI